MSVKVSMKVNGKPVSADLEARTLLVTFIREQLRLTGTHVGCDTAQCGACTVLMNGKAIKSCSIVAMQAEGADILTIEGVARPDGTLHPMQAAFKENHGLQCGFCTPGMVMNALDFAKSHPDPTEEEVRDSLEGNLCRCTGYHNIVKSIMAGARAMAGSHDRLADRRADRAQGGLPLPHRCRHVYRRCRAAGPGVRGVREIASRARPIKKIAVDQAKKSPAVLAVYTARIWRRRSGRPALRLADHRRQRPADEGAAVSAARARQGAARRRARRGSDRRIARPGEGCRRARRGGFMKFAGSRRRCKSQGRAGDS